MESWQLKSEQSHRRKTQGQIQGREKNSDYVSIIIKTFLKLCLLVGSRHGPASKAQVCDEKGKD